MADVTDYTPTVDISDVNDEVWFDIINRTITPKNSDSIEDVLVQNDANSRNFGFMIQRYFENEDLSTKKIKVHYVNSLNMHDVAETHSMEIVGNEQDVLTFKWLVGDKACIEAGAMKFAVEFYDNTGYELYSKAITINITEGIYTHGEIPSPDDWYVTFKRELNELSDMYDEAMEKVQGKLDTENFVGVLSDGTEELNGVCGNHCVGMVESGMANPYIYENWYDSTHDINTQYRIYVPWNGATNGERQMRQRVYNSKTNLYEWSEWKTVDYSCRIDNASFSSLSSFQSYNFKENHIYKFYVSQEVSELLGYDSPQYWLGVYWFDTSDIPTLPEHYMYLTNLYDGKRGKLNLDTFEYTEYNKSSVDNSDDTAKLTETVESIGAKIISGEIKSIVLIGDSITDGYGGTGYNSTASTTAFSTNTAGYCWANAFKKLVEERYGVPVVNRGIWGSYANYQTEQALTVITENDFVIWLSGTNNRMDFFNYEDNLVNYIQSIKAKSAGMLFISNIPSSEEDEKAKSPYTMRSIDEVAFKSARINNVPFLSLYKEYIKYCETNSVEIENTFYDMVHPNDTGYLIMFKILCEKLGIPLSPYVDYSVQGDWWSAVATILDTGYGETGTGFEMASGTIPIFIMSGYNPTDKTTALSGKKIRRIEFSGEDFQAGRLLLVCGKLANIGTGTGALDGNRKCYCDIPTNGVLDFGEDGFFIPENMTLGFGQVVATLPTTAKLCYATGATSDNWCITASTWKSFTSETAPEIRLVAKIYYTE